MHESELERLSARVDALEREVAQLRYGIAAPAASAPAPAPAPAHPAPAPAAAAPPPAPTPAVHRNDVESIVGGRGLLFVGAFLIAVGVASFLKIAFDRGWIGPSMRVAIGVIAGVILIAGGHALRKRLHPLFADTLIGLGGAIEYLSLYAASSLFALLPLPVVALGMIVVTATLCILAYRDDRQPLAHLGIVGGLVSPLLLGSPSPDTLVLFTYLAVLSAGAIALGDLRNWRAVPIVSLVGTALYWVLLSIDGDRTQSTTVALTMALVLYAIFASTMLIAWRTRRNVDGWRIAVSSLNAVWFFFGISALTGVSQAVLAIVFLVVATAHLVAGRLMNQRQQFWFAAVALSFAIPAIGHSFSSLASAEVVNAAIHVAWILEATLIGVLAARRGDRGLLILSGAIFATVVLATLSIYAMPNARFLLNDRFVSLLGAAVGIAIVRRTMAKAGMAQGRLSWIVKVAVDFFALLAISPEAQRLGELLQPHGTGGSGSVAISIAWALYGGTLVVAGVRAKDAVSRWEGLAVLGATVLKVFVIDLTEFDLVFRVISALGLGIVMLALAYLYQTRLRASKSEP